MSYLEVPVEWCVTHSGLVDPIWPDKRDAHGRPLCDVAAANTEESCDIVALFRVQP